MPGFDRETSRTVSRRALHSATSTGINYDYVIFSDTDFDASLVSLGHTQHKLVTEVCNYIIKNINSNDRSIGCPIIFTDINSQCYFVH